MSQTIGQAVPSFGGAWAPHDGSAAWDCGDTSDVWCPSAGFRRSSLQFSVLSLVACGCSCYYDSTIISGDDARGQKANAVEPAGQQKQPNRRNKKGRAGQALRAA